MKTDEISRVKDDLEAMREAVGLRLPFGREDIVVSLLTAAAAVFLLVWSLFFKRGYWVIPGAIPVLAISVIGLIWLSVKRRRSGQPSAERSVHTLGTTGGLVMSAAFIAFIVVSGKFNIPRPTAYAIGCFFVGVMFLSFGILHAPRRRYLALAVAFFVMAVGIPWSYEGNPVAVVGASVAVWGLADAGIMALQLRKIRAGL